MCKRAFVSGKVQGVGYRDFTRRVARTLGLSGYAHNLPDGRVEVLACGALAAVSSLLEELHHGPRWSNVSEVVVQEAECRGGIFTTG